MLRCAHRHDPSLDSGFARQCLAGADEYNAEALKFAAEADRLDALPVAELSEERRKRLLDFVTSQDISRLRAAGFAIVEMPPPNRGADFKAVDGR